MIKFQLVTVQQSVPVSDFVAYEERETETFFYTTKVMEQLNQN